MEGNQTTQLGRDTTNHSYLWTETLEDQGTGDHIKKNVEKQKRKMAHVSDKAQREGTFFDKRYVRSKIGSLLTVNSEAKRSLVKPPMALNWRENQATQLSQDTTKRRFLYATNS